MPLELTAWPPLPTPSLGPSSENWVLTNIPASAIIPTSVPCLVSVAPWTSPLAPTALATFAQHGLAPVSHPCSSVSLFHAFSTYSFTAHLLGTHCSVITETQTHRAQPI